MAFSVLAEDGVVRTFSTSITPELPIAEPTPIIDQREPPVLLPPIITSVYEDADLTRTRSIHRVFKFVFIGILAFFAFFACMILFEEKRPPELWQILAVSPLLVLAAAAIAGGVALVVGNLVSYSSESHKRGEEALRRMWKAYDVPPPPDLSDSSREATDGSAVNNPR